MFQVENEELKTKVENEAEIHSKVTEDNLHLQADLKQARAALETSEKTLKDQVAALEGDLEVWTTTNSIFSVCFFLVPQNIVIFGS